MRFVQYVGNGVLELNYMWLPTWLGMNHKFKKDLEKKIADEVVHKTTADLDEINQIVIDAIVEMHPAISGLRGYLDGIKFIEDGS